MTLNTSTRIAPIVDVSTYCGPFDYESLWQGDEDAEREEGRFVCGDYDSARMNERIVSEANRVFEAERPLSRYGVVSIKATGFGSPREYNFMTDWLDLEVEVDGSFWRLAKEVVFKPGNRAMIVRYAGDNWVSRDGFMSGMLDRVSCLSRNHWEHSHRGTHMATDREVEDALLADLEDAFNALKSETSEDEFREFGAILALLWLVEYPSNHGWATEAMVEGIRENSGLSEFRTVIGPDELKGKVGDALIDFDGFMRETELSYEKYIGCGVGDAAQARAKAWLETVRGDVYEWKKKQRGIIEDDAPDWDYLKSELDGLVEAWNSRLKVGWPGAWK